METVMRNASPKLAGALTVLTSIAAVALRLVPGIPNIYAVGALGLYAGARLPLWIAWAPSMAVMAVTDLYLWKFQARSPYDLWVYGSFLVYVLLGRLLVGSRSLWRIVAVTLIGSLQFFLITNFGVWCNSFGFPTPMYPQTLAGLIECYTMGLPFLKYTLIGDFTCTAAVFAAEALLTQPATEPAPEEVRA
jgi:hypothetical protein